MGRIYSKGDVVFFKNVRLVKPDGSYVLDSRLNGHPFIVLNDIDDFEKTALCLKCSSSKKGKRKNCHYIIKDFKLYGRHAKQTYIDIKNIYRMEITCFGEIVGVMPTELLKEIIELVNPNSIG